MGRSTSPVPKSEGYFDFAQYRLGGTLNLIKFSMRQWPPATYDGGQNLETVSGTQTAVNTYGLHFYFDDPLGTRRAQTDASGVLEQTCSSLPYGDQLSCVSQPDTGGNISPYIASITAPTEHHFTGKERDVESGNDYFGARYYSSAMGRFMSPDWSAKVKPVPYAKLDEPQTLNLYAYVGNNPMTRYDADGHKHKTEEQKEIDNQKVRMGEQKTINQAQDLGVLVLSSPGACTTFLDNHVPGSAVNGFRNMSFFLDRDDTPGNGDAAKITGVNDPRAYAFINPNGAFFHSSTIVNDQENHIHGMYDLALVLNNKDLTGGTMKAKLVIMFHEYAHKIGLFPAERTSSPKLHHDDSIDNNQRTWDACKDQLKNIK